MISTTDLSYMTSFTKSYWCHICKKEFNKIYIENVEVQCRICGGNFCEELTVNSTDHPSTFEPYDSSTSNQSNTRTDRYPPSILNLVYAPRVRPRTTSSFLDMLINILGMNHQDEGSMESIINYIMANDPNRYGNPPASKSALDNLDKVKVSAEYLQSLYMTKNENSCSVCKEEFEIDQDLIGLPCKHVFHDQCILPWLKERNSCPTCRFELPTDDKDYEARKNSL